MHVALVGLQRRLAVLGQEDFVSRNVCTAWRSVGRAIAHHPRRRHLHGPLWGHHMGHHKARRSDKKLGRLSGPQPCTSLPGKFPPPSPVGDVASARCQMARGLVCGGGEGNGPSKFRAFGSVPFDAAAGVGFQA